VEICASVKAIKYIHKYIYKGHDRTTLEVTRQGAEAINELKEYIDSRYISAIESCWHIFEFPMHAESPTVYSLVFMNQICSWSIIIPDDLLDEVVDRDSAKKTTLTAWFEATGDTLLPDRQHIKNFPQTWTYGKDTKKWHPRKQGSVIGRMHFASPNAGERFYLRTLLTVVTGATSLRTYALWMVLFVPHSKMPAK